MIIIDDAIKDKSILNEIRESADLFPPPVKVSHDGPINMMDGSERTIVEYLFWDGWMSSPPDTLKKRIAENIWKKFLPFPEEELYGIEFWTRTNMPGQYSDWHLDLGFCMCLPSDEYEYKIQERSAIGCVYYPDKGNYEESYLEIKYSNIIESVPIKPNRLVIFDSSRLYHRSTPTKKELRYAMPMNLWTKNAAPKLM